ncbi:MAG: glycosyltransferase [Acidobacteriota bacterium]
MPLDKSGLRNVIIVAPEFTPSSYPPALRARFFAQHLAEFGWNPIVLTTHSRNYAVPADLENEKLLDPELEVVRTHALPLKWTRRLGFTDISLRTLGPHWRALNAICRSRKIDLIFISVPPNFAIVLGRLALARFGIPYILDYNDPIISGHYDDLPRNQRPPKWGVVRRLYGILEPFALRRADQIVGVADSYMAGLFTNYPWLRGMRTTAIPFGVEPGDFEYVRAHPQKNSIFNSRDGFFHISHVGAGGPQMANVLRAFFKGVHKLRQSSPELFRKVRMHFVGTTYAANSEQYQILPYAQEFGLDDLVQEQPKRVPHLEAIQLMLESNALVIVGSEAPHYTASKIFPCMLAGKPLLAVLHEESHAGKLLQELNAGTAVTFGSTRPLTSIHEEIAGAVRELVCAPPDWRPATLWDKFEPYTARAVTARLAEVFDRSVRSESAAEASRAMRPEFLK